MTTNEFLATLPISFLILWACLLLMVDVFLPNKRKDIVAALAALGLLISLGLNLAQPLGSLPSSGEGGILDGMLTLDGFSIFLSTLFLLSGVIGIAIAHDYLRRMNLVRGEYYVLLLFSISGMMLMAMAADLIIVFLALELLSFPLYVLSGIARPRPESEEAALKYFLLGAFSSSFVVYGIALVFGATGTTNLLSVFQAWDEIGSRLPLLLIGSGLILVGLGFKVAAVPFHMWTPDVYQGAPTPIVAFMSVGAKAGGFAGLLRVFITAVPNLAVDIAPVLWALSAATMILGNLLAIAQTNIKRLLAYSSIAHAGYIMMALVPYGNPAVQDSAVASALFYLLAYAFTSFAAWTVVTAVEKSEGQGLQIDDYAGLGRKYPLLAAAMAAAMFSFTGIPPTLGFIGKFYLFRTVIEGGYVGLALIGVITSLVSAYYYLRVVVVMYMRDGEPVARSETWLNLAAAVSAIGTVALIVLSEPIFRLVSNAVILR